MRKNLKPKIERAAFTDLAIQVSESFASEARQPLVSRTWLDWIERGIAVILFGIFVARIYGDFRQTGNPGDPLVIVLEFMVVFFILIRRPAAEISVRPRDWALALAGTCLPWTVIPSTVGSIGPQGLGVGLLLAGLLAQIVTKLALNRNFGIVAARRQLVLGGPYRLVRHPIYLSYLIGHLGFLLLNPVLWNLGVYVLCLTFQIARMMAEERVLAADPDYRAYQAKVRYRLIPGVF